MINDTETDSRITEKIGSVVQALNTLPTDDDYSVTKTDIVFTIVSIASRVNSIFSTLLLSYSYYRQDKIDYFIWTLCCFIIPMCITTFLQLSIYCHDQKLPTRRTHTYCQILTDVIILPVLLRYWKTLILTIQCKKAEQRNDKLEQKKYYDLLINEDSDVALIRIFECFLESSPQKILQISIVLSGEENINAFQKLSLCSSIFSMAWCIASYHRCIRFSQIDKMNISWLGSIIQSSWHLSVTISRVYAIAIVASLFPKWTLCAFCIHALIMSSWIFVFDRSPFCSNTIILSYLFSLILGFVFIFNYILPKMTRTRYRFAIFYTICFIENIMCVYIYITYATDVERQYSYFIWLCIFPIVPFVLGIVFMIVYYKYFHPNVISRRLQQHRSNQQHMMNVITTSQ